MAFDKHYMDASQKYSYFIIALSAAVLAYSVQSFDAGAYSNYVFLAPIAWVILLLTVLSGIVRLEYLLIIFAATPNRDSIEAELADFRKIQEGNIPPVHSRSGMPIRKDEMTELINERAKALEMFDKELKRNTIICETSYRVNQWTLVIGIAFLGLFKTLNLF